MIGNTLEEASDLLAAINFIPDEFGRYKLKSKKAVVDYIRPNEKYLERRKDATANILMGNASTFTNEVQIDRSLIVNKRKKISPRYVIKFGKTKDTWFTVWNNYIVSDYKGENMPTIAMRRYLDDIYDLDQVNGIIEIFDGRGFKSDSLSCYKRFQKQLRLLKK